MGANSGYGRRQFLKDSVLSVAKTAQEYIKHRDALSEKPVSLPRQDWLRPPGAVTEGLFFERCTRCGDCVKACPYECIRTDPGSGTPVILPDEAPCRLCEDFPCIVACGTEALLPVQGRTGVSMGMAVVSHRDCMAAQGCNACVSHCPTLALEMNFETFRLVVEESRCVGCGICEQVCNAVNDKIAIKVKPARLLPSR